MGFRGGLKKKETYWQRRSIKYCKLCVKELEAACGFRGWLQKKETYWQRTSVIYCKLCVRI